MLNVRENTSQIATKICFFRRRLKCLKQIFVTIWLVFSRTLSSAEVIRMALFLTLKKVHFSTPPKVSGVFVIWCQVVMNNVKYTRPLKLSATSLAPLVPFCCG